MLYCFLIAAGSLTESKNAVSGPLAIASLVVGSVLGLLAIVAVSFVAREQEKKREEHDSLSIDGYDAVSHALYISTQPKTEFTNQNVPCLYRGMLV